MHANKKYLIALGGGIMTLVASLAPSLLAENDLPKTQKIARYEKMMGNSPFAVATAVAAPAATPNFAKDLYVANAAKMENESVVTIASVTDKNLKEYISTAEPNKNGYAVTNIEWSDKVGATKVTITKDGQVATLTFNQALLVQPAAPNQPPAPPQPGVAGNPGVPAMPNMTPPRLPNYPKPAPIPSLPPSSNQAIPSPPVRTRTLIQRNPNGQQQQQQQQQQGVPPAPAPQQQQQPVKSDLGEE